MTTEDSPVVRLTNALLLQLVRSPASLMRMPPSGAVEERDPPSPWSPGIEVPPAIRPHVAARLREMTNLEHAPTNEPQNGLLRLMLGKDQRADFAVLFRPALDGEVVVLFHPPEASRRRALPIFEPAPEGLDARLSAASEAQDLGALRAVADRARSLGEPAVMIALQAAYGIAEQLMARDDRDGAVAAFDAGVAVARATLGGGLGAAELLEASASLLADDHPAAALRRVEAALAEAHPDLDFHPYVAELHGRAAELLEALGRRDEAAERRAEAIATLTELTGPGDLEIARFRA